jgi:8-oxo-dGTP pyrophosphatase MutT (NUDIX family)
MRLHLDELARRLARLELAEAGLELGHRAAAVAIILRNDPDESTGPEVLLMRRVEHPEDRWSGHVSLPGGHADPGETDLALTAVREAREEVGVDLQRAAELLGRLPHVQAQARGGPLPLCVTPYVFGCREPVTPVPGAEAREVFWFPLARAAAGGLSEVHRVERGGTSIALPCWRFEERVVWGLTHHVLSELLRLGFGAGPCPTAPRGTPS